VASDASPTAEVAPPRRRFADRLADAVDRRESQVVVGLDPDPMRLWPGSADAAPAAGPPAERAASAVAAHCRSVIDAAGPACVAAKAQAACFERLGAPGWAALAVVVEHARSAGLLAIVDAKRGDIDVSAAAYGQALVGETPTPFGPVRGLGADAFTANPYMGRDTLEVLAAAARAAGAGMFVLVRTSNPGAADLQDARLADGAPAWARAAALVAALGDAGRTVAPAAAGPAAAPGDAAPGDVAPGDAPPGAAARGAAARGAAAPGAAGPGAALSDVGAVTGATAPEHLAQLRRLMPRAVFLLPGVGAQGGRVEDLAPAFEPGRAAGLVTASRGIVAAHERGGGSPAAAARAAAERLRAAAWALAGG
jgi:orotidine-5'-phosphate decarboxylase